MLYLAVTIPGWLPAGIRQLHFVSGSVSFPLGKSLKVFCKLKVLNAVKLEK